MGGSLQAGKMPLLMNEEYFIDEVVELSWNGANPGYHGGLFVGATGQVDIGVPVALEPTAPVVFLGLSASYLLAFDLSVTPVIGIRQRVR